MNIGHDRMVKRREISNISFLYFHSNGIIEIKVSSSTLFLLIWLYGWRVCHSICQIYFKYLPFQVSIVSVQFENGIHKNMPPEVKYSRFLLIFLPHSMAKCYVHINVDISVFHLDDGKT